MSYTPPIHCLSDTETLYNVRVRHDTTLDKKNLLLSIEHGYIDKAEIQNNGKTLNIYNIGDE